MILQLLKSGKVSLICRIFSSIFLDGPVILYVTDQRRDPTKVPGGWQGEQGREGPLLVPPDRTPEKFLWALRFPPGKLRITGPGVDRLKFIILLC
jgi:hypothetical protein